MKKLAVLLTILLVAISFAIAGCGRLEPNTGALPRVVPHALDVRFENCNVCHVGDQLSVTSIPHNDFTNDTCTQIGCHGNRVTEPNPLPLARTAPHVTTSPLDNCIACHLPAETGNVIPHSMYVDNSMCLNVGCHGTGATPPIPPPTTTVAPPPTDGTVNPPDTGTTGEPPSGGNVLDKAALPLEPPTHGVAVAAMCNFCHTANPDAMGFPVAPSWAGSDKTPGPWVITAGSDADHTGRNDNAGCVVAGCHAKNW